MQNTDAEVEVHVATSKGSVLYISICIVLRIEFRFD